MGKIDKKIKKDMIVSKVIELTNKYPISYDEKDEEIIKRMLKDVDIASATQKLERAVASRKLIPRTRNQELSEVEKDIQQRFSGIKFNRIVNHLITARYFGYSCFEIIYNEDFTIETLIPIPFDFITYDFKENKWKLKIGSETIELNKQKFLLAIHKWDPKNAKGKSIFDCCNKTFLNKELYQRQLTSISQKYGDIIVIYPYDVNMKKEEREELRKSVENIGTAKSVGAPVDFNEEFDLKKNIDFIKLSDLDPSIYTELEKIEKEKIVQNILGSTLTMDNGGGTGSYSLGEVHRQGFEEVVEEICRFVSDSLYQLIELDSSFFGYNPKDFYWELEKVITDEEKEVKDRKREEVLSLKMDNINKFLTGGYKLSKGYLSNYLGIDEKDIEEVKILPTISNGPEFSETKLDKLLKRIEEQNSTVLEEIEDSFGEFFNDISPQLREQLEKIKTIDDLENIVLNMQNFKDKMLISFLKGITDDIAISTGVFISEELNPFKIKPEEAIQFFLKKTPVLFDKLDDISASIQEKYFYIKKSTSLEVTKALYKNLLSALEEGKSFKTWLKDSGNILSLSGFGDNPWYLELIYRNNMMTSYNAGTFYNQELNKKYKPYGMYDAVGDNRTTDLCLALDGKVYPLNHSFWKSFLPPNHHGCRSRRVALSKDDVKEYGLTISNTLTDKIKELKKELGDFKGNQVENLAKSLEKKETQVKELKKEVTKKLEQLSL